MKLPGQERLNLTSCLQFHSDVTALNLLCSPAAVTRLEGAVLGVSGFGQFWVREIGVKKLLV